MYICLCHPLTEKQLKHLVKDKKLSYSSVQKETKAGTGCGSCSQHLKQAFDECVTSMEKTNG